MLAELDRLLTDPASANRLEVAPRTLPGQLVVSARVRARLADLPATFGTALGRVERELREQLGRRTEVAWPLADPPAPSAEATLPG